MAQQQKKLSEEQIEHLRKIAPLGGQAVYKKYGSDYMSEIGARGYETTVQRHFGGDYEAANRWLHKTGTAVVDESPNPLHRQKFFRPGPHPAHQDEQAPL
jgi:hypothetical protein